jgi:ABC-type tungstate transport system permease subunit
MRHITPIGHILLRCAALAALALAFHAGVRAEEKRPVRVAVIGGMTMTGMWQELATKFEADSGWKTTLVITGPKDIISEPFKRGEVDLLTMHSSDQTTDLPQANLAGARALADWLVSGKGQAFLIDYGRRTNGGIALYFPVNLPDEPPR